ncbi:MAG: RidA family protein [Xanthomonadales bacterium]|nr:RidA family protein [Xanthomonadales bacterium]
MKNRLLPGLLGLLVSSGALADVEARLKEMGVELYPHSEPSNPFVPVVQTGNLAFTAGHGPKKPDGSYLIGRLGDDLTVAQGAEAARLSGIAILSSLKHQLGDLDRIKRFVKVLGMVNATEDFTQHSQVINGFSELILEAFGEKGRHARSAVGMQSLPIGFATEIEVVVELHSNETAGEKAADPVDP